MSAHTRNTGKRKSLDDSFGDESLSDFEYRSVSPESDRDREKRLRREIANSNERRRMQSINSGFQALRMLIPNTEGEKLSKAAILQQTSEYIFTLEQDKTKLLQQNTTLKRILSQCEREGSIKGEGIIPRKRNRAGSGPDSSDLEARGSNDKERHQRDENSNSIYEDDYVEEIQKELIELRCQLEKERRLRISLEAQKQKLEFDLNDIKLKTEINSSKTHASGHQSLDTIVQAIRHLEGKETECDETPMKYKSEMLGSSSEFASRRLIV
ncbi:transcription factor AP-4 [Nematostella vectensis]|uniref:transcription factor AP-4 n=1 Tax=Nematostella vectensis TaxID=45351 RepID=UPI00138F9DA4|nr:transcription factor AP-4 [Nematostella vectensis]